MEGCELIRQPHEMFVWGGSVITVGSLIPVFPDVGINRELCRMVQKGWRQIRFRGRLIPSLECIMKQSAHELLGVTHVEGHPGVMHDRKMLMVPVKVYIGKQPGILMEPDQ